MVGFLLNLKLVEEKDKILLSSPVFFSPFLITLISSRDLSSDSRSNEYLKRIEREKKKSLVDSLGFLNFMF